MKPKQKPFLQNLDLVTTILPFGCIALLCCLFMLFPEGSANILASIRFFLGDELGSYYLLMGLGAVICSLYMASVSYTHLAWSESGCVISHACTCPPFALIWFNT